jgi:hypothetical protein
MRHIGVVLFCMLKKVMSSLVALLHIYCHLLTAAAKKTDETTPTNQDVVGVKLTTSSSKRKRKRENGADYDAMAEAEKKTKVKDRFELFRMVVNLLPKINVDEQKARLKMMLDPSAFEDRDVSLPDNREYEIVFRYLSKVQADLCRRKSIPIPPMSTWPVAVIYTLTKNDDKYKQQQPSISH